MCVVPGPAGDEPDPGGGGEQRMGERAEDRADEEADVHQRMVRSARQEVGMRCTVLGAGSWGTAFAVVLADAGSLETVPDAAWAMVGMHHEVVLLSIDDPLERDPPRQRVPLHANGVRMDLDLGSADQWRRWRDTFCAPAERAAERLGARGMRVVRLSASAPSHSWLRDIRGGVPA